MVVGFRLHICIFASSSMLHMSSHYRHTCNCMYQYFKATYRVEDLGQHPPQPYYAIPHDISWHRCFISIVVFCQRNWWLCIANLKKHAGTSVLSQLMRDLHILYSIPTQGLQDEFFLLIAGARLVEGSLTPKKLVPGPCAYMVSAAGSKLWAKSDRTYQKVLGFRQSTRNMHMQFLLHRNVRPITKRWHTLLTTIRYPYAVETNHNNHSEEGFLKRSPLRKRLISECCVPICWHMRFANLHGACTFHHVIWATVHCPFPQAIKRRTQHHITSLQASCWLQSAMILKTFAQRPFIQEGHATSLFPRFSLSEVAAMHIQARRGRGRWKSQGNIL